MTAKMQFSCTSWCREIVGYHVAFADASSSNIINDDTMNEACMPGICPFGEEWVSEGDNFDVLVYTHK